MKLYSGPLSLFTQKVRIALAEKGLPYERIEVDWSLADRYIPHHPEVVKLNPKRQVPVLVDGDVVVYDSTVILEYLEDRHPDVPLYPRDAAERSRCRQQEAAADEIWFPHIWDLIEERLYPAAERPRDSQRADRASHGLHALYGELDAHLQGRDYYCGDFSVADIATFVMTQAASQLGTPPSEDLVRLAAWRERMGARAPVRAETESSIAYLTRALAGAAAPPTSSL